MIRVLAFMLGAWVALGPAHVVAQRSTAASGEPGGRVLFERAMSALRGGDFSAAVESFTRSLELEARPATAFNLAIALRGVGRFEDGLAVLERMLGDEYGSLADAQRSDVEALSAQLRSRLAHFRLRVQGPERAHGEAVEVRIGRRRVEQVVPFLLEQQLDPGTYQVVIEGAHVHTHEEELVLQEGVNAERRVVLSMPDPPATVRLHCDDPRTLLELEGIGAAHTLLEETVPAGTYRVAVRNADGEYTRTVSLHAGEAFEMRLDAPRASRRRWWWTLPALAVLGGGVALAYWALNRSAEPRASDDIGHTTALVAF